MDIQSCGKVPMSDGFYCRAKDTFGQILDTKDRSCSDCKFLEAL